MMDDLRVLKGSLTVNSTACHVDSWVVDARITNNFSEGLPVSCGWGKEDRGPGLSRAGTLKWWGAQARAYPKEGQRPERAGWGDDWRPVTHTFIQPVCIA